jgi:chromosome segregation ATPase
MATIERIDQELNKARGDYEKAVKELKKFEEGEDKQKKLVRLEEKLDDEKYRNKEQKERWEGWIDELKKEKKRLEEEKKKWGDEVVEWGKRLREFGGGEGNEQIA